MDLYLPIVLTVTLVMVGLVIGVTWALTRAAQPPPASALRYQSMSFFPTRTADSRRNLLSFSVVRAL